MNLSALLETTLAIQTHVLAVTVALVLGLLQLVVLKRGTRLHRAVGWMWITAMVVGAISSFFIHSIRLVGLWSPIHLLSVMTLLSLVWGIHSAKQGKMRRHGIIMSSLFLYALIGAGAFTLLPGRLMHTVLFG